MKLDKTSNKICILEEYLPPPQNCKSISHVIETVLKLDHGTFYVNSLRQFHIAYI